MEIYQSMPYETRIDEFLEIMPEFREASRKEIEWWANEYVAVHVFFLNLLLPFITKELLRPESAATIKRIFVFVESMVESDNKYVREIPMTLFEGLYFSDKNIFEKVIMSLGVRGQALGEEIEAFWPRLHKNQIIPTVANAIRWETDNGYQRLSHFQQGRYVVHYLKQKLRVEHLNTVDEKRTKESINDLLQALLNTNYWVKSFVDKFPDFRESVIRKFDQSEEEEPGLHIIFGDVLDPFLMRELETMEKSDLLVKIFDFLESMATSDDEEIIGVLSATILERLGDDETVLTNARSLMKGHTKNLSDQVERQIRGPRQQLESSDFTNE